MDEQVPLRDRPLRALLNFQSLQGYVDIGVARNIKEAELLNSRRLLPRVDLEGEAVVRVPVVLLQQAIL